MRGRQPLKITWLRNRNYVQHSILDSARRTSHVPLPAISSFGGLRTPAPECVAPSSWAGIRKPSQKLTSHSGSLATKSAPNRANLSKTLVKRLKAQPPAISNRLSRQYPGVGSDHPISGCAIRSGLKLYWRGAAGARLRAKKLNIRCLFSPPQGIDDTPIVGLDQRRASGGDEIMGYKPIESYGVIGDLHSVAR